MHTNKLFYSFKNFIYLATSERSFSLLKRVKTFTRNCIGEDRLSSLSVVHFNNDISIDVHAIVRRMENKAPRRFSRKRKMVQKSSEVDGQRLGEDEEIVESE